MDSSLKKCERKNNSRLALGSRDSPGAAKRGAAQSVGWNFIFPPTAESNAASPGFPILRQQKSC